LSAQREAAAVPDTAIAADLDQPLDILAHLLSQLTLYDVVLVYEIPDAIDFVVSQVSGLGFSVNASLVQDLDGGGATDSEYVTERNLDFLVAWNVHTGYTGHARLLPLPLLVAGV
jgi:hypothetical protein